MFFCSLLLLSILFVAFFFYLKSKMRKRRETRKNRKIKLIKIYTNTYVIHVRDSMLAENDAMLLICTNNIHSTYLLFVLSIPFSKQIFFLSFLFCSWSHHDFKFICFSIKCVCLLWMQFWLIWKRHNGRL